MKYVSLLFRELCRKLTSKKLHYIEMNSYARPDVRYCRDYLHSKCKQGLFGILEARLLTSQVRNVNNKGQQNDKKPRFYFECK